MHLKQFQLFSTEKWKNSERKIKGKVKKGKRNQETKKRETEWKIANVGKSRERK